ncbi:hypothetical protein RBSH_02480 [Rhodopirellula baltica SH28]|nr:hypothetical protein RBSH_02480 [Rhodopirellula baltica SH28]ELP32225.1 hypothetical protein RBSWK_03924 [Rhodopirellula baltica SWK14]
MAVFSSAGLRFRFETFEIGLGTLIHPWAKIVRTLYLAA